MALPSSFTTVTRLSKTLALILFIALPFLGFFLGMSFQEVIDFQAIQTLNTDPSAKPHPAPSAGIITNWKIVKLTDKNGFGYELKIPTDWENAPWRGGHDKPDPIEIAQNFHGERCGRDMQDEVSFNVLHFMSRNPELDIAKYIGNRKSEQVVNQQGVAIKMLTDDVTEYTYAYIVSPKGYYVISKTPNYATYNSSGSEIYQCSRNPKEIFNQILATFKFTQ